MKYQDEYMTIYEDFKANSKFFQAIAHLSRPAVSHHLNVLKDAGIIHCRPEGTSHYYYISIKQHLPHLYKLNHDVGEFLREYYKDDEAELEKFDKMGIPLK